MIIRLKFSLFEHSLSSMYVLLQCLYGLDTHADKNKSLVWGVIPQNPSKQANLVLFKVTHLQEAAADRNVVLGINCISTTSLMSD